MERKGSFNERLLVIYHTCYLAYLHPKDCLQLCSFRGKEPSFFNNYFDSETKKHLEKSFEMMATGIVGVVIGVALLPGKYGVGTFSIFSCSDRAWQGLEEFKKAMETSDIPLENVHFVTWYDDYEKNTEELTKNSILEPWKPLDTSGLEIMDEQYKRNQLDPSLSKNIRNYG